MKNQDFSINARLDARLQTGGSLENSGGYIPRVRATWTRLGRKIVGVTVGSVAAALLAGSTPVHATCTNYAPWNTPVSDNTRISWQQDGLTACLATPGWGTCYTTFVGKEQKLVGSHPQQWKNTGKDRGGVQELSCRYATPK